MYVIPRRNLNRFCHNVLVLLYGQWHEAMLEILSELFERVSSPHIFLDVSYSVQLMFNSVNSGIYLMINSRKPTERTYSI